MLCVLKRIFNKTLKLIDKNVFTVLHSFFFCLARPMDVYIGNNQKLLRESINAQFA